MDPQEKAAREAGTWKPYPSINNNRWEKKQALYEEERKRALEDPHVRKFSSTIRSVTPESTPDAPRQNTPARKNSVVNASEHISPPSSPPQVVRHRHSQRDILRPAAPRTASDNVAIGNGGTTPAAIKELQNRPRTRTLEERNRDTSPSSILRKARNRVGSIASTASSSAYHGPEETVTSIGHPSTISSMPPPSATASLRSTKSARNRLAKPPPHQRSSSPVSSSASQIDLPPRAIPQANARKIFHLMRSTCGRMEGMLAFRRGETNPWSLAYCIINDDSGSLVYEPKSDASYYRTLISDLRSCEVRTALDPESHHPYLDVTPHSSNIEVHLRPHSQDEYESWFAALLCWQPIKPRGIMNRMPKTQMGMVTSSRLVDSRRHSEVSLTKDAPIIKVGKMIFWDMVATSEIGFRSTGRSSGQRSRRWRRVSCTLRENGELKLYSENDVSLVSMLQLSQLSRCAIQRLDPSVLDTEFCIAIYPHYTSGTGTPTTNTRPVYISLETRVLYEVWLVLLRAFTTPQLYGPKTPFNPAEEQQPYSTLSPDMFRMERSISIRVVQARLSPPLSPTTGKEMHLPRHPFDKDPYSGGLYTEIQLDNEPRAKTIVLKDAMTPFWREDFEFMDLPAGMSIVTVRLKERPDEAPSLKERTLKEEVKRMYNSSDSTGISSSFTGSSTDQTVGHCDIYVDDLEASKEIEKWWPLTNKYGLNVGEVQLAIRSDEAIILMAREFQPLSELLHRFSNGLTLQIGGVLSTQLVKLAEFLLNIFQVSGKASEWLQALVEEEIDGVGGSKGQSKLSSANRLRFSKRIQGSDSGGIPGSRGGPAADFLESPGRSNSSGNSERELFVRDSAKTAALEANLLFRANTLCTKAIDMHMRRLGREYLDQTLGDKMKEIADKDPECEVDPNRVESTSELDRNWRRLLGWTSDVWKCIYASVDNCPAELRLIFRHVMACAEDRYGDFLRTVRYSSVSGFLFLRLFCPAVLGPKLFGLLQDNPKPKARRALTFIAKILMALGNMSTFGAKEPWMENANSFLSSHRQQFKDFIDNICSIPSETATSITAIQPSYSTPLAILQRLAPGSREGFPSLPYLIDHARSFAELVDLWLENTKNQAGTMQEAGSGGDLARFNNVCVQLRKRTQDVLARAEPAERPGSALDAKWEAVVEDLVQDSGLALGTSPPGPAAMGQLYGAPPGSSHGRSAGGERGGPAGAATSMSSSTSQYAASESTADEQLAGAEQGMGSLELNGNGEGFWMEEDDESDVVKGRMWTANEGREGDTTALPSMGRMGNTTRITGKVAAEEASRSREKIFSFGRKKKR